MIRGREPRIALAGSVGSTYRTLQAFLRHKVNLVGVLGLSPARAAAVSGYSRLDDLTREASVPYKSFEDINAPEVIDIIRRWAPDLLFVVGLSQLVHKELLSLPRLGCVGFHPTFLPEGRGRAPVAWLALEGRKGAATFFVMEEEPDAGPILVQEPFEVSKEDYAGDIIVKLEAAIDRALDDWLPRLKAGEWQPVPQDDAQATYYGRRSPEDGLIQWEWPAQDILALVRAASRPHPGAYTYLGGGKLIVWRAAGESRIPYHGVPGRILAYDRQKGWLIQTGKGLLWLTEIEAQPVENGEVVMPKVGIKLGISVEAELRNLHRQVKDLEDRLSRSERVQKKKKVEDRK